MMTREELLTLKWMSMQQLISALEAKKILFAYIVCSGKGTHFWVIDVDIVPTAKFEQAVTIATNFF